MNFNIVDNIGAPMFQVDNNPYLWIGSLGRVIDIRLNIGSLGAPLYIESIDDNGIIRNISVSEYIRYVEQIERGIKRQSVLEDILND